MELFRKLRKSLDMTPSAPKMGRIPLPDVGEGEGKISPSASYSSTSSSYSSRSASSYSGSDDGFSDYAPSSPVPRIRAPAPRRAIATSSCCTTPRTCTPQPPPSTPILKPALKRSPVGRTSTPQVESFRAPGSRTSTPQASSPPLSERSSTARKDVPKKPLKGILKRPTPSTSPSTSPAPAEMVAPSQVSLHWRLLPFDRRHSKKKIEFDIMKTIEYARECTPRERSRMKGSDLDKFATSGTTLNEMHIRYSPHPQWTIKVTNPTGITCRDVFNAIHHHFQITLSASDKKVHITKDKRKSCEDAFKARCRVDPGLDDYVRKQGMRRVDMLGGKTFFRGLTRPVDDKQHWVLELGDS